MNNLKKKKKGFTLIELIIVLAVMAIIALIAIPNFTAVRENSKKKADNQSCAVIERAVLMLTADDTITITQGETSGKITIDFTPDKNGTVTKSVTPSKLSEGKNTNKGLQEDIEEALGEVNAPQEKDMVKYTVEIKADGTVTAVTAPKTASGNSQGTGEQ